MAENKALASSGGEGGLSPEFNSLLRQLAGWPRQSAETAGTRYALREMIIHRDANGRITSSSEHIVEEEVGQYSQYWGK